MSFNIKIKNLNTSFIIILYEAGQDKEEHISGLYYLRPENELITN